MKKCIICDRETDKPIRSALSHFKVYQSGYWQYLKGNIQAFGYKEGVIGTLGLVCPLFNTLKNWKYLKYRLFIDGEEY